MAWTGKQSTLGFCLAASGQTWGTTQTPIAGNLIKQGKIATLLGAPAVNIEQTTDASWLTYADQGNVDAINHPLDFEPRFSIENEPPPPGTSVTPVTGHASMEDLIFSFLYGGTTCTRIAATSAYEHYGTEVTNHALANVISRWGTLFARIAADSGYKYLSIPSWKPTSLKWTSKAGKDPVKVAIGGLGNKVELDNATISGNFATATFLQVQKLLHHYHLGNDATNGGVFFTKANPDGGAAVTFDNTVLVHPEELDFTIDRKEKGVHTDSMYSDEPQDDGYSDVKVSLTFPKVKDALFDGATQGIVKAIKNWEAGTQDMYHLKARYTDGAAFDATNKAVFEWGFSKLRPIDAKYDIDAGKMIPLKMDFEGLMPTSYAQLPTCFKNGGAITAGTAFDLLYFYCINQHNTAYIA